jgi:hypothetical protein
MGGDGRRKRRRDQRPNGWERRPCDLEVSCVLAGHGNVESARLATPPTRIPFVGTGGSTRGRELAHVRWWRIARAHRPAARASATPHTITQQTRQCGPSWRRVCRRQRVMSSELGDGVERRPRAQRGERGAAMGVTMGAAPAARGPTSVLTRTVLLIILRCIPRQ